MGDPPCWMDRVCPSCGHFLEDDELDAGACAACGAAVEEPSDAPAGGRREDAASA